MKLDPETITAENLTLDQWRPVTAAEFVTILASSGYYDGETFTGVETRSIELPQGSCMVFYTCDGFHDNENTEPTFTPELLIHETLVDNQEPKRICFTRT